MLHFSLSAAQIAPQAVVQFVTNVCHAGDAFNAADKQKTCASKVNKPIEIGCIISKMTFGCQRVLIIKTIRDYVFIEGN